MSKYTNLRQVYFFDNKHLLKRCVSYFLPFRIQIAVGFLSLFAVSGCSAALAYLVKPALDEIFLKGDHEALVWVPLAVVAVTLVKGVFRFLQNYLMNTVGLRVLERVRNELYDKVLRLPARYFDQTPLGVLMSRVVEDAGGIRQSVPSLVMMIREGVTCLGLVGVVLYQNVSLAFWAVLVLPLGGVPFFYYGRRLRMLGRRGQEQQAEVNAFVQEAFGGVKVIKAFARERREKNAFYKESRRVTRIGVSSVMAGEFSSRFMEMVGAAGTGFVLWYGGMQVVDGKMTPGTFFSFMAALVMLYDPLKKFSACNIQIQKAMAGAERVFGLLDAPEIRPEQGGEIELAEDIRDMEVRDVTFRYPEAESPALDGVSLSVRQGRRIAIVGPSGGGKSTLANLLPRFYDPQEGSILINGQDIREYTLPSLRMRIGMVSQDTFLFNASVRENIAYAIGEHSQEAIESAAKAAYAHEFILQLPNGYDTVVGERGVMLSGGQKQRLTIARALLKNPPLLILDEATSALDTESEQIVQQALDNLMRDRTSIVIAHRLSTILNADRILVMENGKIIAAGSHAELLGSCPLYANLHSMQFCEPDFPDALPQGGVEEPTR